MTVHKLPLPNNTRPLAATLGSLFLEAQDLTHAEADYAAVMASREHLRQWCGDDWPGDEFTLEENREDLAGHIEEAQSGFAYGYTVFDSFRLTVLGSVYLYPAAYFADRYALPPDAAAGMRRSQVLVDYWLRPEYEQSPQHDDFVRLLGGWLRNDWGYSNPAWSTRPAMKARRMLYDRLGFHALGSAESRYTADWWQFYHISPDG